MQLIQKYAPCPAAVLELEHTQAEVNALLPVLEDVKNRFRDIKTVRAFESLVDETNQPIYKQTGVIKASYLEAHNLYGGCTAK